MQVMEGIYVNATRPLLAVDMDNVTQTELVLATRITKEETAWNLRAPLVLL